MKLYVWLREEDGRLCKMEVSYKRPRRYMCGWSFEQLMAYIQNVMEWQWFKQEEIESFEIVNEKEQWCNAIHK